MRRLIALIFTISAIGCTCQQSPIQAITVTNTVEIHSQPEFGPDGYGCRHLTKQESDLVYECLIKLSVDESKPRVFTDLMVFKKCSQDRMTENEIVSLLESNPVVAGVWKTAGAKLPEFAIQTLAFPQYESDYKISKTQWQELQNYCRLALIDPIAITAVVEHWKSITNGVPPFGLKVQE